MDEKLHKDLIETLESFQKCLRGDEPDIYAVDFDQCIKDYFARNGKREDAEKIIKNDNPLEWSAEYDDIIDFMKQLRQYLQRQNPQDILRLNNKNGIQVQNLLGILYPSNTSNLYLSFMGNYNLIRSVLEENEKINLFVGFKGENSQNVQMDFHLKLKEFTQYRFYKYYAYFETLQKLNIHAASDDEKVMYAVGEIYRRSLTTMGNIGISEILRMPSRQGVKNVSRAGDRFIRKDFKKIINALHKVINGTICENNDFRNTINKYKVGGTAQRQNKHYPTYNNPLFYSDSPYLGTSDYDSSTNEVSKFGEDDMNELLYGLKNSEGKFIFSCRALKSQKEDISRKEEIDPQFITPSDDNLLLYRTVYNFFLEEYVVKGKNIYVLAIEKGGSLKELIDASEIAEIMITNYEIHSFSHRDYPKVSFKVYKFMELYEMIAEKYWKGNSTT